MNAIAQSVGISLDFQILVLSLRTNRIIAAHFLYEHMQDNSFQELLQFFFSFSYFSSAHFQLGMEEKKCVLAEKAVQVQEEGHQYDSTFYLCRSVQNIAERTLQ